MLIATLLHLGRQVRRRLSAPLSRHRHRRARRVIDALPPELQRDIGWPPEIYPGPSLGRTLNEKRSMTS
ncbi:MAG: hypothetical protein ACK4PN_12925 [Allorhizobium sp.]